MSGDVKDQGVEGGSLTAADLDRLAALHEAATPGPWECDTSDRVIDSDVTAGPVRRVNGKYVADWLATFNREDDDASEEQTAEQDAANAALTAAAITALPSLLALARRGLEADAAVEHRENILLGKYGTPEGQQAAVIAEQRRAESAESKLAAALAEVERVRGRLEKATEFQEDGPGPNSLGWSIWWHPPARVWVASNCAERFPTLDAAWSAAEAQSGHAAKQGGENVGGNEHGSV
jgi:hypothetical protein